MFHTFTDDPDLMQIVADYKAAVAVVEKADTLVARLENRKGPVFARDDIEASRKLEQQYTRADGDAIAKHAALQALETRLAAAFVWALEHAAPTTTTNDPALLDLLRKHEDEQAKLDVAISNGYSASEGRHEENLLKIEVQIGQAVIAAMEHNN